MPFDSFFSCFPVFFAEAAQGAGGQSGSITTILIFGSGFFLLMYFLMIRPGKREQERQQKLYDSLDKHVKVYTVGGIVGMVHSVDRDKGRIVLKVDDANNTKIEFLLSAVAAVLEEENTETKK